jgi:hypothetical protein
MRRWEVILRYKYVFIKILCGDVSRFELANGRVHYGAFLNTVVNLTCCEEAPAYDVATETAHVAFSSTADVMFGRLVCSCAC